MLKLRRLELSGFKSFVDPTDLEFSAGITAVVGPNGCGKSNVADAITWALGEQSAKSLRGATMEDVIFNGTDARRPLGMAEVTLALDTEPGAPGSENGQMMLSRRVFRSGESQYRLNGKLVRLKDFRDLLMDTGLGLRAYSVIEQGRIGMILSGKPQERRRLLEEAAGVTRYRNRQRVAEVKLEEAQANLLRLNDIIAEIERALRSLKRQAGAAKRLHEKRAEARRLLHLVLTMRRQESERELTALAHAINEGVAADSELAAAISREEAALAQARAEADGLAADLAGRHRRQGERGAFIEGRQRLIKEQRQAGLETGAQLEAGTAAAARRNDERVELEAALTAIRARAAAAEREHAEAALAVRDDENRLAASGAAAASAESELERLRADLLAALAAVTHLRNQLHREQIESEKGSYQRQRLGEQLTLWKAHAAEAAAVLAAAARTAATTSSELATAELGLEAADAEATALQTELDAARESERDLRRRLEAARHRQGVLGELSAANSERRAAWIDALAAAGCTEPMLLADGLRPAAGWERGLDSFLGDLPDAAWIEEADAALALATTLSARGVVGQLLSPQELDRAEQSQIDDPAIVSTLADALGLDARQGAALPPAYLVSTPEHAQRLAPRHPGVAFIASDRFWARGGALHLQGESAVPGLLERRRESTLLVAQIGAFEGDLAAAAVRVIQLDGAALRAADRLTACRAACVERREEMAAARARLSELEARHQRLTVERSTLSLEHDEVERELARVSERERTLHADLGLAESRHRECEASFDAARERVEQLRSEREARRTDGASRRGRLDLLGERLRGLQEEAERLERRDAGLQGEDAAWREEEQRLAGRRSELDGAMAQANRDLQEALEETTAAESALASGQTRLEERRLGLRASEEAIQARRLERDDLRATLGERRVRQATLRQESEHIAAAYFEEFREPMTAAVAGRPEAGAAMGSADLAALETELAGCKQSIEQLGPVNVLAGDEYGEQEERHGFLVTQRADVVRSIDSLKATIREINQTSSERFAAAFREVNEHFGRTFSELFRGGEAEMRLLDEEDLLESGIEIVARPPGKRLQNLMLLSGGEKALTAIALLFALFRAKPSPFCILDEVDAPLDDLNTLRFVELLSRMAGETQFIVITHNKLTMEAAARLYGVTMEERGVSKLVSVTLADVQPATEPAAASA